MSSSSSSILYWLSIDKPCHLLKMKKYLLISMFSFYVPSCCILNQKSYMYVTFSSSWNERLTSRSLRKKLTTWILISVNALNGMLSIFLTCKIYKNNQVAMDVLENFFMICNALMKYHLFTHLISSSIIEVLEVSFITVSMLNEIDILRSNFLPSLL